MLLVNLLLILSVIAIAFVMARFYSTQMFFDISILLKLFIVIIPIVISIINLILLPILSDSSVLLGFIPLLIPLTSFLYSWGSDYFGGKFYDEYSKVRSDLHRVTQANHLNLTEEDFIIRIRNRKNVNIVVNVYSDKEELEIKGLRQTLLDVIASKYPKQNVRILIDRKKN